jgi:hypothetical protein
MPPRCFSPTTWLLDASLPIHRVLAGQVPRIPRYYQGTATSCRPSRRASLPSLGGTTGALGCFRLSRRRRVRGVGPGVGCPVSPSGIFFRGNDRISQVPGEPQCPFAHVQSTPAGLLAPDHYGAATWPLVCEKQRLPRKVFRRSIAWLSDWLSTLRSAGYPATTQDSLPAAGQALPDGLSPAGFLRKVSKLLPYIFSSFPKLAWRNHIDRCAVPAIVSPR